MKMLPGGNSKSQHLGGEDRQNSMSLRPAYSTESVPGQPPKPYLKKPNKQNKKLNQNCHNETKY